MLITYLSICIVLYLSNCNFNLFTAECYAVFVDRFNAHTIIHTHSH